MEPPTPRPPSLLQDATPLFLRIGGWVHVARRTSGDEDVGADTAVSPMSVARLAGQLPTYTRFGGEDVFARVSIPLHPHFSVWSEYHSLRTTLPADPWFVRGGSVHPESDAFAGALLDDPRPRQQLLELGFTLKLRDGVSAHASYGRASGTTLTGAAAPAGDYGYVELTLRY